MEEARNKITVYVNNINDKIEYHGKYYIYREDWVKEGCVHFKDEFGKHHRVYGGIVIIDEE